MALMPRSPRVRFLTSFAGRFAAASALMLLLACAPAPERGVGFKLGWYAGDHSGAEGSTRVEFMESGRYSLFRQDSPPLLDRGHFENGRYEVVGRRLDLHPDDRDRFSVHSYMIEDSGEGPRLVPSSSNPELRRVSLLLVALPAGSR